MKPFQHQVDTTNHILSNPRCLITNDAGTGKTRSVLDSFAKRKKGRMLVLAPLSILQASWGDDIDKFQPNLTYAIGTSSKREKALTSESDIVLMNHDAVNWFCKKVARGRTSQIVPIVERIALLDDFDTVCIDEFTAFKNPNSQRSKAAAFVLKEFEYRIAMSGTPNTNTILDIWYPTKLVDDGERLGQRFSQFRGNVCTPVFNGFGHEWRDKDNAEEIVASSINDINIRFKLEDCIDMPEQSTTLYKLDLPKDIQQMYDQYKDEQVLMLEDGNLTSTHAGSVVKKLLQICSGSVYNEDKKKLLVHNQRYELVMDLVDERDVSLVAFNYKHERDALKALMDKRKWRYEVIDGDVPENKRADIVNALQAGQLKVVLVQPASAGHGLTMTRAKTIIWTSPTYSAEHYQQFNRRIYRIGQKDRTQIIRIAARNTIEPYVYKKLDGKVERIDNLLSLLNQLRKAS